MDNRLGAGRGEGEGKQTAQSGGDRGVDGAFWHSGIPDSLY
jgi:hypothetical protein